MEEVEEVAAAAEETEEVEEGIVIQEIQCGYTMHDKLLRPAMVGVSKKPTSDKEKKK